MAHALLSPSSAERWLNCTPSALMESTLPDKAGDAAAEGTLAHSLGELIIRYRTNQITKAVYATGLAVIEGNVFYAPDMFNYCNDYAVFVLERYAEAVARTRDALLFLETKLDMSDYVPEGFGTGDVVIVADHVAEFIDLKYGKGVRVDATNNKQMMLYALGVLRAFGHLYDIHTVRMSIYQPRIHNHSTFEITVTELLAWADSELKPRAEKAFKGLGDFVPGKWCQFCKIKATCKTHYEKQMELAAFDFKAVNLLTPDDVSHILSVADSFKNWIGAVEEYALNEAVHNGAKWPGYKLVEGRSNRTFTNIPAIEKVLKDNQYPEEKIYTKKLVGITEMEKLLTKPTFAELLGAYVIKPAGKPTLVEQSDKRPEFNSASNDFKDLINK